MKNLPENYRRNGMLKPGPSKVKQPPIKKPNLRWKILMM